MLIDQPHTSYTRMLSYTSNISPIVFFLEIGLDYPDELSDLYNYYFGVDGKTIATEEMLSQYQFKIIAKIFFLVKTKNVTLI